MQPSRRPTASFEPSVSKPDGSASPGPRRFPGICLAAVCLLLAAGAWAGTGGLVQDLPLPVMANLQPPLPDTATYPLQLVLDDNSAESAIGLIGAGASRQFMWLNSFAGSAELEEIWIYFPAGQGVSAGDAIQIVVYDDPDGDPANGADLVYSVDTTVQTADGVNFSIYPIPPTQIDGNALVGVIPRYIVSGVTPPTSPAALDTTASQGRSYLAFWLGDPPAVPDLPPDDEVMLVDSLVTGGGNWTIRAFGVAAAPDIPVATPSGLALLSLLLAAAAAFLIHQRRPWSGLSAWRRR